MITVTVYTVGTQCVQCDQTLQWLPDAGIRFVEHDLTDPAGASTLAYVTEELGYTQAPIVQVEGEAEQHWSGFRPDLIKRFAASLVEDAS